MRPQNEYLNYTTAKEVVSRALPEEHHIALDKVLNGLPFLQKAIVGYGFAAKTPGVQPEVALGIQQHYAAELSERHLQPHIPNKPDANEVMSVLLESGFSPEMITKTTRQ